MVRLETQTFTDTQERRIARTKFVASPCLAVSAWVEDGSRKRRRELLLWLQPAFVILSLSKTTLSIPGPAWQAAWPRRARHVVEVLRR